MNKHIPGPWTLNVDSKFPRVATIVGPQGKDIEIIAAISNETEMATLRLIAAAPDLLDGLKQAVCQLTADWSSTSTPLDGHLALIYKLTAVIAKAEAGHEHG